MLIIPIWLLGISITSVLFLLTSILLDIQFQLKILELINWWPTHSLAKYSSFNSFRPYSFVYPIWWWTKYSLYTSITMTSIIEMGCFHSVCLVRSCTVESRIVVVVCYTFTYEIKISCSSHFLTKLNESNQNKYTDEPKQTNIFILFFEKRCVDKNENIHLVVVTILFIHT